MRATIDRTGRLVIPKAIRDRLVLKGGEELEVEELEGLIQIRRAPRNVELVNTKYGLRAADPTGDLPGLGPDEVREQLERIRR